MCPLVYHGNASNTGFCLRIDLVPTRARAAGLLCAAERARRASARGAEEEAALARARAWRDVRRALTGERGLWAEPGSAPEAHWRLDASEDPSRRSELILKGPWLTLGLAQTMSGQAGAWTLPRTPHTVCMRGVGASGLQVLKQTAG